MRTPLNALQQNGKSYHLIINAYAIRKLGSNISGIVVFSFFFWENGIKQIIGNDTNNAINMLKLLLIFSIFKKKMNIGCLIVVVKLDGCGMDNSIP